MKFSKKILLTKGKNTPLKNIFINVIYHKN